MQVSDEINLSLEERLLFIINDNTIMGSTRLQGYGFLLHMEHRKKIEKLQKKYEGFSFYRDWKPHRYGPYSQGLSEDVKKCEEVGMLEVEAADEGTGNEMYSLTPAGYDRWHALFDMAPFEVIEVNDVIRGLQCATFDKIMGEIYFKYPEFATVGRITNRQG